MLEFQYFNFMDKTVIELFTGVGGFRVGLDHYVLPVADKQTGITSHTKQSFCFNKDFIEKIIKE